MIVMLETMYMKAKVQFFMIVVVVRQSETSICVCPLTFIVKLSFHLLKLLRSITFPRSVDLRFSLSAFKTRRSSL